MSANLIVKRFDIRLIYTQILVCLSTHTLKKMQYGLKVHDALYI